MSKDVEKTEYGTGTWDTPPSDEDYTLEEILAEYGSSRQQKIMEEVERVAYEKYKIIKNEQHSIPKYINLLCKKFKQFAKQHDCYFTYTILNFPSTSLTEKTLLFKRLIC